MEYSLDRTLSNCAHQHADPADAPTMVAREERQVSLYRVGALDVEGRRELCVIRNVSSGGMMINAYSQIAPETVVSIEFKHGDPIKGVVVWTRDNMVGVQFDEPIDVSAVLASSPDGPRPRMPRIDIHSPVTVREEAKIYRMCAIDISQGGVCVEGKDKLTIGADVVVSIGGLAPEAAVVRWHNGDCYGLGFNRLLSVPTLADWLQQHRQSAAGQSDEG